MVKILLAFSQSHVDFRIAEFIAICDIFSISINTEILNTEKHLFVLDFNCIEEVENILSRSILIKYAFELFAEEPTYEKLYSNLNNNEQGGVHINKYSNSTDSFALRMFSIGRKKKIDTLKRIEDFLDHVQLGSAIVDLKSPKNQFFIVEEYEKPGNEEATQLFFCKLIGTGQVNLKTMYNLQNRCYIGNTTMDPELSFIQANIARIRPNSLVLDPFVGTGGLILPAAEFGAFVMGTEINYQTARAKGKSSRQGVDERGPNESIIANFKQYSTESKLLSIVIADSSRHGIWKKNPQFDAIVADPPYGVREKARKIRNEAKDVVMEEKESDYVRFPEKEGYNLENTYCDLLDLAANSCVIGGRVSFWYPVILENYCEEMLPTHPVMQLIANCEQRLTKKSSRRLLTYRKIRNPETNELCKISKTGVSSFRNIMFA